VQSWIGSGVQLNGEYIIVYADGTLRKSFKVDHIIISNVNPRLRKGRFEFLYRYNFEVLYHKALKLWIEIKMQMKMLKNISKNDRT